MNAVVYARYSSSKQGETTIEQQLRACTDFAISKKYYIVGKYVDRKRTGKNTKRPEFQRLIEDSKDGLFQVVLVYKNDRFARNIKDSRTMKEELEKNGVTFISVTEPKVKGAAGIMQEGMIEVYSEFFSAQLSERVTDTQRIKAQQALYNGGPVPLGFRIDENMNYQIDDETAPIVKKIFNDFANDKPIVDIISELNRLNIKTSRGTPFNKNSFQRMLRNMKYLGNYAHGEVEIPDGIPSIIDQNTFNIVQKRLEKNSKTPAVKDKYMLTSKLFCGYCKEMMIGKSGTSKNGTLFSYYACKGRINGKTCNKQNVPKNMIEEIIINSCLAMLTDYNIAIIAKKVHEKWRKNPNDQIVERFNSEILKCKSAINHLLDTIEDGGISESVKARLIEREATLKKLETDKAIAEKNSVTLTEERVLFFLTDLRQGMMKHDYRYNKMLIRTLINRIFLYDDKFTIFFNASDNTVEVDYDLLEKDIESAPSTNTECSHRRKSGVPKKETPLGRFFFWYPVGESNP